MMIALIAALTISQAGPVRSIDHVMTLQALDALKEKPRADESEMVAAVINAGELHHIDPLWLLAVAYVESRYKLSLKGDGGNSHGPFQMCMSACRTVKKDCKEKHLHQWGSAADINARYWSRLFRKYKKFAPVVYNCGPNTCKHKDGTRWKDTPASKAYKRAYRRIKRRYKQQ